MLASRFFSAATASAVLVGFQRVYLMYLQHEWTGHETQHAESSGALHFRKTHPVQRGSLQGKDMQHARACMPGVH